MNSIIELDNVLAKTERITLTATPPMKVALQFTSTQYCVTMSELLRNGVFRFMVTQYPMFTEAYYEEFTRLLKEQNEQD